MVSEVAPFEFMKLRMLNGAHSSLAYLGYLAGHETVAEASGDPGLRPLPARALGRDHPDRAGAAGRRSRRLRRRPARPLPQPGDPPPHLADRHGRLAEAAAAAARHDPRAAARPAPRSTISRSASPPGCATSPARTRRARPIDVRDPLARGVRAKRAAAAGRDAAALSQALLGIEAIFGSRPAARGALHAGRRKASRHAVREGREGDGRLVS